MRKSPHENQKTTGEALLEPFQGVSPGYIFSEETVQSLQALGVILRRIHNRLETEKAAAIGAEIKDNASIKHDQCA